jgi:NADH-ubiquinone oxidoreductase chain 6
MTNTLYILNETYTNGYNLLALNLFSLSSVLCAISVIISKNPIVSVLFLIGLFLSIASYLITIGINFIGLSYLLVYVGAVSILFLFILMLINVRISELFSDTKNSIPLVFIVAILFSSLLSLILPHNTTLFTVMGFKLNVFNKYTNYLNKIYELYSNELYYATTNI